MTKKKILVVEDDNIIGMEIRDRIKNIGYDVPEILSYGEDAVEKVGHIKPDLILMDIHLNGEMDGIQAAEQIREIVNIPVVYLTAYADDSTLQRAKKTEPFGYVIKPFEERDLASTIEMALYKHQMDTKLKNNERWLTTTLRSIGDGVIATNREGKINYMNPVAESLTGWLVSDIMYKDLNEVFKLVEDKTRAVINNPIEKVFKKKAITELPDTTILISKDNVERPVLVTYSPLIDDKNNVTGVVLVFQDNTERKKAQETLSRQNQYNEIRAELWKLATDKSLSEDQLITRALQIIGPALNVSRACYSNK
ncbi:hypothetical protein B6I21_00890 [candidate division KSB1 bacterium 4572_119]|nr:MAG: hypothetical protein B6I21_00890 [candidate division KSB1 bacterium 4572_119]